MFTGIVEELGTVVAIVPDSASVRSERSEPRSRERKAPR